MRLLAVSIVVGGLSTLSSAAALAETKFSGRVIEFGTNKGLPEIRVTIQTLADQALANTKTNNAGEFVVTIPSDPEKVSIVYDPPDPTKYGPAARRPVQRTGPTIVVGTVGLTNLSGPATAAAKRNHALNLRDYALAGGDKLVTGTALKFATEKFGREYEAEVKLVGGDTAMRDRGVAVPF